MIATITNHISKGVQNYNDTSKKMTWFKTNFNMPVPNYMVPNNPFTRYSGSWNYLTETTSYDLTGFVPGYEICNGCAIFDFNNDGSSTYNIDTYLYVKWVDTDNTTVIFWIVNGYHYTYSLPAGYYIEVWYGGNIGCCGWEVDTSGTYYFKASASGTPSIPEVSTSVVMSNVPSTTQLASDKAGYIWVEGNNLCYICADRWKHTIVGVDNGSAPGTSKAGYIWLDTNVLHWVGADGHDYYVPWTKKQFASFYGNGPTGETYAGTSKYGMFWVDNEFGWTHLAAIANDGYKYLIGAGDNPYA
jgi:hypothetical protein